MKKQAEMPSGFGWQVFGVFMILLAIVIVFMWFGSSGNLLDSVHKEAVKTIGFSVYLVPAVLVYLAISIFRAEGNRLPMRILISTLLMLVWFTGLFGVFKNGGSVGVEMDKMVSGNLGSFAAVLIYAFLIFVTSIFVLQVSPMAVFAKIRGKKREANEDDITIDAPVKKTELKISGDTKPVEKKPKKKFSLLKKSAIKKPAEKKEISKASIKAPFVFGENTCTRSKQLRPDMIYGSPGEIRSSHKLGLKSRANHIHPRRKKRSGLHSSITN